MKTVTATSGLSAGTLGAGSADLTGKVSVHSAPMVSGAAMVPAGAGLPLPERRERLRAALFAADLPNDPLLDSVEADSVRARFVDRPDLSEPMLRFLADPLIPGHLRRIVYGALVTYGCRVATMPPDLRAQLIAIDPHVQAVHIVNDPGISNRLRFGVSDQGSVNRALQSQVTESDFKPELGYSVYAATPVDFPQENFFLRLVHELAHVFFHANVTSHLDVLEGQLPDKFFFRHEEGFYALHEQVWSFLFERYAHERELDTARATVPAYFAEPPFMFSNAQFWAADPVRQRRALAKIVLQRYGISEPQLQNWWKIPLEDLLFEQKGTVLGSARAPE